MATLTAAPEAGSNASGREPSLTSSLGQLLQQTTVCGLLILDGRGRVRRANPGAARLLGRSLPGILGRPVGELLPQPVVHRLCTRAVPRGASRVAICGAGRSEQIVARRSDGRRLMLDVAAARLQARGPLRHALLLSEAAWPGEERARLEYLAYHDAVTELPNRAFLMDRLADAIARRGDGPILLFADLDGFKGVNDALGHDEGDRVLRIVGQRLAAAVRPVDTVARHGGDEFVVLMEEVVARAAAEALARRLIDALREPIRLGDRGFRLSVSVGIAAFPEAGADPQSLLRAADRAMYRAKAAGGALFAHAPAG